MIDVQIQWTIAPWRDRVGALFKEMKFVGAVERADGGFRVSAGKPFGSGSPKGGVLITSAPYDDAKEGWQVLHFTVPFTAPGVSLDDDWRTLGMRATGSHTIILDNV